MQSVTIIGIGRVGGALALALDRCGYRVSNLISRSPQRAGSIASRLGTPPRIAQLEQLASLETDIVIIASADPYIGEIGERICGRVGAGAIVVHTSGSLASEVLEPCRAAGCETGSLHPLLAISDPRTGSERLRGTYFCVEGTELARSAAWEMAKALGGRPFTIPGDFKTLYHAAAVTASGHITALADISIHLLAECGLEREAAGGILVPLMSSAVANISEQGTEGALTGPFERLDADAVKRHIAALNSLGRESIRAIYLELGETSIDIVERRDGPSEPLDIVRSVINMAKSEAR